VLNRCLMFTNEKSHIKKWTHGSVALTWHEIACRCFWWSCDENVWPCMKFVGYMLFVLILTMCRSYAHERDIFVKNTSFDHGYVTYLYVPIYLLGDALRTMCGSRTGGWLLPGVMSDWQCFVDWFLTKYYRCRLWLDWCWCRWRTSVKGRCRWGLQVWRRQVGFVRGT
jgi:hypothetical protein